MFKAIFFDFNGVILDDEEHHYESLRRVLEEEGVRISREAYYRECLGFNDTDCFLWGLPDEDRVRNAGGMETLVRRKSVYYQELLKEKARFFPGVCEFIREAAARVPLGLASMALRSEIEWALGKAGIGEHFLAVVSGEDVKNTKPDPEAYLEALRRLNRKLRDAGRPEPGPSECLVVEDSAPGVESARRAGMRTLGLAHSVSADELRMADRVLPSLEGVSLSEVEALFEPGRS